MLGRGSSPVWRTDVHDGLGLVDVEDLEDVRVRPHAAEDLDLVVQALLGLGRPVLGVLGDHLACAERARLNLLAVLDHGERASAEHLLRQLILVLQTAFADELQLDA